MTRVHNGPCGSAIEPREVNEVQTIVRPQAQIRDQQVGHPRKQLAPRTFEIRATTDVG
jgi:hypothetical protein